MTPMKVGKCKWTLISPGFKLPLPCPCDQGIFTLEEGPCEKCDHTVDDHGESSAVRDDCISLTSHGRINTPFLTIRIPGHCQQPSTPNRSMRESLQYSSERTGCICARDSDNWKKYLGQGLLRLCEQRL